MRELPAKAAARDSALALSSPHLPRLLCPYSGLLPLLLSWGYKAVGLGIGHYPVAGPLSPKLKQPQS